MASTVHVDPAKRLVQLQEKPHPLSLEHVPLLRQGLGVQRSMYVQMVSREGVQLPKIVSFPGLQVEQLEQTRSVVEVWATT